MKVLIVGSGGREHALAWKAAQSDLVEKVYVAPGNAGTALEDKLENIAIAAEDIRGLTDFATQAQIELTIVGPEAPLVNGIVDAFIRSGLRCFGPTKKAAILEGSKSFSKDFLKQHHIPTAEYEVFTDMSEAVDYIRKKILPVVIKADGLAAGKGVVIARTEDEAITTLDEMLIGNKFGKAGHQVLIEDYLQGEEASFIVLSDGKNILPLASSQDHKARDDVDLGPNTGGMGAYSPAPVITPEIHQRIMQEVILPTVEGMAQAGRKYSGFLYAGLMIDTNGHPKVLEFNCRFGDPETQPIIMRLQSDLVEICNLAIDGMLGNQQIQWDKRAALGVVLASKGYPESASKGDIIRGFDTETDDNVKIFHAGTKLVNDNIVTNGGRVLCVTALGDDVTHARQEAYATVDKISWDGMFYRKDIGYRAVTRESGSD